MSALNCGVEKVHITSLLRHPIECLSDDDYKPRNNMKRPCKCGMNGIKYCSMAESDVEMRYYRDNYNYLNRTETFKWNISIFVSIYHLR